MDEVLLAFEAGRYTQVRATLEGCGPQNAREFAMLGMACLRLGHFVEAETPLIRASVLGDLEAQVELGNLLRLMGRFEEAVAHFQAIEHGLSEELLLRCLRWWGLAEFQQGKTEQGLHRCERAWYGYMAMGDEELTARVTQSVAWMHSHTGNYRRAKQLYREAVRALPSKPSPLPRLTALNNLINLHLASGDFGEAQEMLAEGYRTLEFTDALRPRAFLMTQEADLCRLTGNCRRYLEILELLRPMCDDLQDYSLRVWVVGRLAEHYSLEGLHSKALEVLFNFGPTAKWPPELLAVNGILARRRGQYHDGRSDLEYALKLFRERGDQMQVIRCQLHLADAILREGDEGAAATVLRDALSAILHERQQEFFRPDFEELSTLLQFAMLEPELAPYLDSVHENLAHLVGLSRLPEEGAMHLRITTLGRVSLTKDNVPVTFEYSTPGSVMLLVYLALNPGRTRKEMQLDLYPDKDDAKGSAYIRRTITDLRKALGPDVIAHSGPHNCPWYRLGRNVHVDLDLVQFHEAIAKGQLAPALALYRGEFLKGVDDNDWVLRKREEALLALTIELRNQMSRCELEGDYRRFILLANQYLRADPYDYEVLEARVRIAKLVAPPHDIAKYEVELNRLQN